MVRVAATSMEGSADLKPSMTEAMCTWAPVPLRCGGQNPVRPAPDVSGLVGIDKIYLGLLNADPIKLI